MAKCCFTSSFFIEFLANFTVYGLRCANTVNWWIFDRLVGRPMVLFWFGCCLLKLVSLIAEASVVVMIMAFPFFLNCNSCNKVEFPKFLSMS